MYVITVCEREEDIHKEDGKCLEFTFKEFKSAYEFVSYCVSDQGYIAVVNDTLSYPAKTKEVAETGSCYDG